MCGHARAPVRPNLPLACDKRLTLASRRHLALVRRAEAIMWKNVGEPLTIAGVCVAVKCSERTLTYAFKEVLGVGPMTYIKERRLNAVHSKLRAAAKANVRIYDVAMEFGFWHSGHFSADYKAMFGETPSRTLAGAAHSS